MSKHPPVAPPRRTARDVVNLVTAVDRDGPGGRVTRLAVGIADIGSHVWLVRPRLIEVEQLVRRLASGERFRTLAGGETGQWLSTRAIAGGLEELAPVEDELPTTTMFDDLGPC